MELTCTKDGDEGNSGGSRGMMALSLGCPGTPISLVNKQQRWGVLVGSLRRWQQGKLAPDENQQRARRLLEGRVQKGGDTKSQLVN